MRLFEDETITSFGDTPAPEVSTDTVTKAEDEVEDKEAEQKQKEDEQRDEQQEKEEEREAQTSSSDEEPAPDLETMLARLEHYLEYGTPAGVNEVPGSCPSCEDAADAVAIDAGIEETEGSGEDTSGNDMDGDLGGGEDTAASLDTEDTQTEGEMMQLIFYSQKNFFPGMEELDLISRNRGNLISNFLYHFSEVVKNLGTKIIKYTRKVWKWSRNKITKSFMKMQTIAKFWDDKLSQNLDEVEWDRFAKYNTTAFPCDLWITVCKAAIAGYDLLTNCERVVFDKSQEAMTNTMGIFDKMIHDCGVEIKVGKDRVNSDGLYDNRVYGTMEQLGYDKSKIPVCLRYLQQLGKRMKGGDMDVVESYMSKALQKITSYSRDITEELKENQLKEDSPEYKTRSKVVVLATSRYDYLISTLSVMAMFLDQLTSDILVVFSKVEDSMVSSKFVDQDVD